jgi:CHAT domain-containing protein
VRNYFLKSEQRQEKLRFALALKEQREKGIAVTERGKKRFTPYLAIAASVLAIIGIGFFTWRTTRPTNDLNDGLVALQDAYREQRPIEGRLSDFKYVPLANQRGGSDKVDSTKRDLAAALLLRERNEHPSAASHQAAGKYYLMIGQFDQALKELDAALALDPNNAKIHNDLGAVFLQQCLLQRAEPNGLRLELCGRSLEHVQRALALDNTLLEALFNRALLFQTLKSPTQAIASWKDYLAKDSSSQWAQEAQRNLKQLEQAQPDVSRNRGNNFELFVQAQRNSDDDAAWKIISETYTSAGNEITNQLLDSLFEIAPADKPIDSAESWRALAYVARVEGSRSGDQFTADLLQYYRHATPALKPILATARRHMRTGYKSFEDSRFNDAIREYRNAQLNYEQANDKAGQAFVEYRLAHCYLLLPEPEKARVAFNQLLATSEANRYHWLAARCLFGLAHASADLSQYSRAIEYSSSALQRFEQYGDLNGIIKTLTQLADLHQEVKRSSEALEFQSRAWTFAAKAQIQTKERWSLLNGIGASMRALQLPAAALFFQREALNLAVTMNIPLLVSRSYSYLSSAYASMKMYDQAVSDAKQAFDVGRSIRFDSSGREMMAQSLQQLGDIYRDAGQCDEALKNYDSSLELYKALKFDFHAYAAHKRKLQCYLTIADKQKVRDELRTVLGLSELYRRRITVESQRNSFFDAEQEVYDLAIGYESGVEKDYVKALDYSEQSRARSLLDAVNSGRRAGTRKASLDLRSPVVSSSLTVPQIQKKLPANSQMVQYAVLDEKTVVWVVTNTAVKQEEIPVTAEALTAKVNAFLETVNQRPNSDEYKPDRAIELYNLLIAPIERHLERSKFLVIVPDKVLNYLAFAALVSPATSRCLIEEYNLGAAASGSLFVNLSATATRKAGQTNERLLTVGNPKFDRERFSSLRDLPSSLTESKTIAGLYENHRMLSPDEATEANVTAELAKAEVAHLAMHFVLNDQTEMMSGFPLTPEPSNNGMANRFDGFLQSYEICRLDLRRMHLIVLSACQTGIEKQYRGEGAVGAARPFFIAGVPTVVATLWPVDSDASAALMVSFHKRRRAALSTTQALREAQIEMLHGDDAQYRHPYYWAGFLSIGGLGN